ncbi:ribonuclease H-like domain-containing protein [Stenotrophomonas phage BUCT603]|nr:ribonuclease H-like domain-containing protein [Stenotrophomonas phage BUCT603]
MKKKDLRAKPKYKRVRTTYDLAEIMQHAPKTGPKILHIDIETSLMRVWTFGLHQQYLTIGDIITDWNILSFAAKWHGTGPILYQSLRKQANPVNDFGLCKSLHKLLSEADIVVAHNGKRFDMKKIRARMLHNRMPPIPDVRVIDTFIEVRKVFGLTSNKLAYITEHFGADGMRKNSHGKFPGKTLWIACQTGNQQAWDEMEKYNIPDVLSMEAAFNDIRPWFYGQQNIAVFHEAHDGMTCDACGGTENIQKGFRYTQTGKYKRYQCTSVNPLTGVKCGHWFRGRVQQLSKVERAHIGFT